LAGSDPAIDCRLAHGAIEPTQPANAVNPPTSLADAVVVEIRRSAAGEGWVDVPLDAQRRLRNLLPCVVDASCDEGREGMQARVVHLEPAS
jgi:hypothetical protein